MYKGFRRAREKLTGDHVLIRHSGVQGLCLVQWTWSDNLDLMFGWHLRHRKDFKFAKRIALWPKGEDMQR